MTTFYRKERTDIFNRRFSVPSRLSNAWTLKSRTVFEAKQKIKAVTVLKKKNYLLRSRSQYTTARPFKAYHYSRARHRRLTKVNKT